MYVRKDALRRGYPGTNEYAGLESYRPNSMAVKTTGLGGMLSGLDVFSPGPVVFPAVRFGPSFSTPAFSTAPKYRGQPIVQARMTRPFINR